MSFTPSSPSPSDFIGTEAVRAVDWIPAVPPSETHRPFRAWFITKLRVVHPEDRRFVASDPRLFFSVGRGGPGPAARLRPVAAGDRSDRAACPGSPPPPNPASSATASAAAAHTA